MNASVLALPESEKTWLDRLMSLVAEVQPGEALTALLLSLNVFLLLAAYYIIRPVREALILAGSGAEIRSYLGARLWTLSSGVPVTCCRDYPFLYLLECSLWGQEISPFSPWDWLFSGCCWPLALPANNSDRPPGLSPFPEYLRIGKDA